LYLPVQGQGIACPIPWIQGTTLQVDRYTRKRRPSCVPSLALAARPKPAAALGRIGNQIIFYNDSTERSEESLRS